MRENDEDVMEGGNDGREEQMVKGESVAYNRGKGKGSATEHH